MEYTSAADEAEERELADHRAYMKEHATVEVGDSPVQEMRVCEIAHLILRPGQLYRFSIDPECPGCAAYGGGDYELTLDAVPAARRLL